MVHELSPSRVNPVGMLEIRIDKVSFYDEKEGTKVKTNRNHGGDWPFFQRNLGCKTS
jgi:hypothetical protein